MDYKMNIAGLDRNLPLCKVTDDLYIAAFILFNDVEITRAAATELLKKAPEFDVIITAESKGIPLAYEMARQAGNKHTSLPEREASCTCRMWLPSRFVPSQRITCRPCAWARRAGSHGRQAHPDCGRRYQHR